MNPTRKFSPHAVATAAAGILLVASLTPAPAAPPDPNQELVQISTINALIKGLYDGDTTIGELRRMGSFGIGTLNHLDGEMLALDGEVYQATSDGKINKVPDDSKTPFASVTAFSADSTTAGMKASSYEALQKEIDAGLPSENLFYAIKVTGTFTSIKMRSVVRQQPPYRPLTEVVKEQSIFHYENTSGTLVGFRCPDFAQGINVAAYHLHFLSQDKLQGGHVLGFEMTDGTVEIDVLPKFRMILPQDKAFLNADLSRHSDEAIHQVETLRAPAK